MTSPRIAVIGESVLDIVVREDGSREEAAGGSPANVAVGLARLGARPAFLTQIAEDYAGRVISQHLHEAGVLPIVDRHVAATPTAVACLDRSGAATYDFRIEWSLAPEATPPEWSAGEIDHLHVGSIGALAEPGATAVREAVTAAATRATVSFDPNLRPGLMPPVDQARRAVDWFVSRSDVVKASDEDIAAIHPERDPLTVAAEWSLSGPDVVVVTRGAQGSVLLRSGTQISIAAPRVAVVDTVGAGDSYMAALIDGLRLHGLLGAGGALAGADSDLVAAAAARAAAAAAITVGRRGAQPPTAEELDSARPPVAYA